MASKTSSQAKARLLIAAVFIIGFAAGALSLNLYQKFTSAAPVDPRDRSAVFIQRMDEKVSLSEPQKKQVRQILDSTRDKYGDIRWKMEPCTKDFNKEFDAVRQQSRNEIRAVLTEKQLPEFEKMVEEQDRERERIQQEEREKHSKK